MRHTALPIVLAAVLVAGCNKEDSDATAAKSASQTAVRVNGDEITVHQINMVLERQPNLKPEQTDQASRTVLESLIDQELAVQQAVETKLDRDPQIVQLLDASRRNLLARAYLERTAASKMSAPTTDEITKYYGEHPALFSKRRVFMLQEYGIQGTQEQINDVLPKLRSTTTVQGFGQVLGASGLKFAVNQVTQPAEALPLNIVDAFADIKDGQALYQQLPEGLKAVLVVASQAKPLTIEQARPVIARYLAETKRRELMAAETKALRTGAKVEYIGKFAEPAAAASAPASAAAPAPVQVPTPADQDKPAASEPGLNLDEDALKKGLSGL